MTPDASELRPRQLRARWWWLDLQHAKDKCEAALAWETLRRTKFYPELWGTFTQGTVPVMKESGKPSVAGVLQQTRLIQMVRGAVGQLYLNFLINHFNPALTWLELRNEERLKAQGFVLGEKEALRGNGEYLLPRQKADPPKLGFAVVELGLDNSGHIVLSKQVTPGISLNQVAHLDFFRHLALQPGRYVSVFFDTRGARDALLAAFDDELDRWVGNWSVAMEESGRFAILWNGEGYVPVEYWAPQSSSGNVRAKRNEVAVIPSDNPGFAILLVSARHNPATVRASFHTHLKSGLFRQWRSRCVDYWKTVTVESSEFVRNPDGTVAADENGSPLRRPVLRYLFNPEKHLPPKKKAFRSARRSDLWFGLAANDVVVRGLVLGKTSAEGAFLYGLSKTMPYATLRNHQRSAARRLKELDQSAAHISEALARQNRENAKLAKSGFFDAAAGEASPGAAA